LSRLTIAVDAHAIGRRQTGNEVYVRSLIRRYPQIRPDADFVAYTCCDEADEWMPEGVRHRKVARNPFARLGYDLASKVSDDRPDLLHVQYTAPVYSSVPIVATVHDVSYIDRPDYLPRSRALQLKLTVQRTVKRAAKIITVSEFSRQRIAETYGLDPDQIAVTLLAAQKAFQPMNHEAATKKARNVLGIDRPFLLNVGDLHPRKNQIGLIRAFSELIRERPELPHVLVMAGQHTWFAPRVLEAVRNSGVADRIVLTRFVDDETLRLLYNGCDLFVFPSFYEGFGLPVIEAMACGRPVVCSSATALPEVTNGAAVLFEPHSTAQQMRAMRDVLLDRELSERMQRKSLHRSQTFDWNETARRTLDVYSEVAEIRTRVRRRELVAR